MLHIDAGGITMNSGHRNEDRSVRSDNAATSYFVHSALKCGASVTYRDIWALLRIGENRYRVPSRFFKISTSNATKDSITYQ
jgi:hypothetical protein